MSTTQNHPLNDRKLVDQIVYLASLASEAQTIDPKLDVLRRITARWDGVSPFDDKSRGDLTQLSNDLKSYLIEEDPLRSFTSDTLEMRLRRNFDERSQSEGYIIPLAIGEMLLAGIIALPLPVADFSSKMLIFVTITMQFFIFSALWFYLSSLKNFKPELRHVFITLCAGIAFVNLGILQYALLALLQQVDDPLLRYGGRPEFAALGVLVLYFGAAKYARILKIPTRKLTVGVLVAHLAIIPIAGMLAMMRGVEHPQYLWLTFVTLGSLIVSGVFSAMLITRMLAVMTLSYAKSLSIIRIFMLLAAIVAFVFGVGLYIAGSYSIAALAINLTYAGLPTLGTLMVSGYSFKRETGR